MAGISKGIPAFLLPFLLAYSFDGLTTSILLSIGGREVNPFLNSYSNLEIGIIKIVGLFLLGGMGLLLAWMHKQAAEISLALGMGISALVSLWNTYLIIGEI